MTTHNPQASSACQPTPSSSPIAACNESTPSPIRPEWIPLDEVAQAWAEFSWCVTSSPSAFQASGMAFLALSFEMSAHQEYAQAYQGLWQHARAAVAQGIGQAILDLLEACKQWASAILWLERFANEERRQQKPW